MLASTSSQIGESTRRMYCGNLEMLTEGLSCCRLISVPGIFTFQSGFLLERIQEEGSSGDAYQLLNG